MKVAEYDKYGPPNVLKIKERAKPSPRKNEVLIKIYATTVSSADSRMRAFDVNPLMWLPMGIYLGFSGPRRKILGFSLAGIVESVGEDVSAYKKGDQIFGSTGLQGGAHAEYICLPETSNLIDKPSTMTFEEAACLPFGGTTALHFLRKGNIQPGQKVLVYGASGSVGTAAVQIAKYMEAEVTGVCSASNMELVKSLGANSVLDYKQKGFLKHKEEYDVIFDTVGKSLFSDCIASLKKEGIYLRAVHMEFVPFLRGLYVNLFSKKRVVGGIADDLKKDLEFLRDLYLDRKYKPVIDRAYLMNQIVEAHSHVDTGHKVGNVVIKIAPND